MNLHRSVWLALPLALLLPIGCASGSASGPSADGTDGAPGVATQAAQAAPAPVEHAGHHGHHARGTVAMLFHAARDLDLTDAQRTTIDGIQQQMRSGRPAAAAGHQAVHAALVEGVRAGSIDTAKIASLQAAAAQDRKAHADREATALNGLWSALQPAQRAALVASVRERRARREARFADHAQGRGGEWQQHRLDRLTTELGLDATQQKAVEGILASSRPSPDVMQARREEMKKRTDALLTAFASDSFDAHTLDLAPPAGAAMAPPLFRAEVLSKVVPILRADQREKLAASMEKRRG